MTDDKQALVMLGQIMGRLDERAKVDQEFRDRLTRIEDAMIKQFESQGRRLNALEVNFARESMKHGAIGGTGAGVAITAAVEVLRKLLGH